MSKKRVLGNDYLSIVFPINFISTNRNNLCHQYRTIYYFRKLTQNSICNYLRLSVIGCYFVMEGDGDYYPREVELDSQNVTLTLYQKVIGDVSCVVWDASLVLAKYIDLLCEKDRFGNDWLRGKKVLELGAGLGCVGITAACLGAEVVLTDLDTVLPSLKKNLEANKHHWEKIGGSARALELDWSENNNIDFAPDIIVLSDCVYYAESTEHLLDTLERFCKSTDNTYILLCQEERNTELQRPIWATFVDAMRKRFNVSPISLSEQHPQYSSRDIRLLKLTPLT